MAKRRLGISIGPLGNLYHEPLNPGLPVPRRFEVFMDYLTGHGFAAYGVSPLVRVHSSHYPALGQHAAKNGVELHYVWSAASGHVLDGPLFQDPVKLHASNAIQAKHLENAAAGNFTSYTIHPPHLESCSLEDLSTSIAQAREGANTGAVRVHVMNPWSHDYHLSDLGELRDWCRDIAVTPSLHVGHDYSCTSRQRSQDEWREVVREFPAETLFLYANVDIRDGGMAFCNYTDDDGSTPRLDPFLQSIQDRSATLLVEGGNAEADALGALVLQARLQGVDPAQLMQDRGVGRHRRFTTPRNPTEA